jgi:hypothetical protein
MNQSAEGSQGLFLSKSLVLHGGVTAVFFSMGVLMAAPAFAKGIPDSCKPSTYMTKLFTQPAIEKRVGKAAEWNLSPELTKELEKYWENPNLSLEQKLRHTYERTLEERAQKVNPVSRVGVKLAARNILDRTGWYQKSVGKLIGKFSGTHYNPITNSIFMSTNRGGRLSDFVVAFHEMQHAVDRNSHLGSFLGQAANIKEITMLTPTPIGAATTYAMESKAIGSQWELMQQIPESQRKVIREAIVEEANTAMVLQNMDEEWAKSWLKKRQARKPFSAEELKEIESLRELIKASGENLDAHDKIAVMSIDYANLPKDEFINKMRDLHGYTVEKIMKRHYAVSGLRKYLLYGLLGPGFWIGKGIYDQKPENIKAAIEGVRMPDVRLYLRLIATLALEEEAKSPKKSSNRVMKEMEKDLDRELKQMAKDSDTSKNDVQSVEKKN